MRAVGPSLGRLGIVAVCSAMPIGSAVAARQASVAVFGPRPQTTASFSDGIRRSASAEFTLVELDAARGSTVVAPPEDLGVAVVSGCITSVSPPLRPSLPRPALARRQLYWPIVRAAECRHGLPAGLLDALVITESQYQTGAVSWAGAVGLTQLMPTTASSLGVSDRFNPTHNIDGGARYLSQMIKTFSGSVSLALAAYNAGPGAVKRSGGIPMNGETPAYVERVLKYWRELAMGAAERPMTARRMAEVLGFLAQNRTMPAVGPVTAALEER